MPRTVSASEAKTRFGSIVDWTIEQNDDVIVEAYGKPKVVIMPFAEYERVVKLREKAFREEALARLERLREKVQARNQDLGEEEADALADRLAREVASEMVGEGKVRYQGQ